MNVVAKSIPSATIVTGESVTVRSALPRDLKALVALEQRSFAGDRISQRQYLRHLRSQSAQVLVAERGARPEQILGSAVVFFRRNSSIARLYSLAVVPEARGLGLGLTLLEAVQKLAAARRCRTLRLEVRDDNTAAIGLYERHGYAFIERVSAYYEDGKDALRYEVAVPARR